jgi:hypothetical protein
MAEIGHGMMQQGSGWKYDQAHPADGPRQPERNEYRCDTVVAWQVVYPEYKANRGKTPEDLVAQFPIANEACQVWTIAAYVLVLHTHLADGALSGAVLLVVEG